MADTPIAAVDRFPSESTDDGGQPVVGPLGGERGMAAVATETEEKIRLWAEAGDRDAIRGLFQLVLEDPAGPARKRGREALASIAAFDAVQPLVQALSHERKDLARNAAEALGELGDERAVAPLLEATKESDPGLRAKAIEALGRLRAAAAVERLIDLATGMNVGLRILACEALGRVGDERGAEPLLRVMGDANAELRRTTVAPGKDPAARAMESTNRKLADDAWILQWVVATALARIGSPKGVAAVVAWSHRIYSSELKKFSAEEKMQLVREVMDEYLPRLPESEVAALPSRLQTTVRLKSWQALSTVTDMFDWLDVSRENPLWTAVQEELARRSPQPARVAPPPASASSPERSASAARSDASPERDTSAATPPPDVLATPAATVATPSRPGADRTAPLAGAAAAILDRLARAGLDRLALGGESLAPLLRNESPETLDFVLVAEHPRDPEAELADPFLWNDRYARIAREAVERAATALGIRAADLRDGTARFVHEGRAIPVRYLGPFAEEWEETVRRAGRLERRKVRAVSLTALVCDAERGWAIGPGCVPAIENAWVAPGGKWEGQYRQARRDLADGILSLARAPERMAPADAIRLLAMKHRFGLVPDDAAIEAIESAVAPPGASREALAAELDRDATRRYVESAPPASVAAELSALGLLDAAADVLGGLPPAIAEARRTLDTSSGGSGGAGSVAPSTEALASLAARELELAERKDAYEACSLSFSRLADSLDAAKAERETCNEKLRAHIGGLTEAEKADRAAADRLETATRKFRDMTGRGGADLDVLREHRESLAAKHATEEEVQRRRREVEWLRSEVEGRQGVMQQLQTEMGTMGGDLEAAMRALVEAQEAVAAARANLEEVGASAVGGMDASRRRAILAGVAG